MAKTHSVWFLGTSSFAVPALVALLNDPLFSVDLVITQPDRPAGRKQELTKSAVKVLAEKHGLKIEQPENINSTYHILHTTYSAPDYLVVISFGQILSEAILDIPKIAAVNVHASLLPRWRGASPLQHAILAGDHESGVTVQKIVKELDAGPVLAQEKLMIEPRETFTTLHDKLAPIGAELLIKTLKNSLQPIEQDTSKVTICRTLKRDDGKLDHTSLSASDIDRKVRALNPWPGVTLIINGQFLKLLETSLEPGMDTAPLSCDNETVLHLVKVQPAGGKPMMGAQWARGRQSK
ncbi:MAG: methionyl-tRNA formyltransferase [Candidatus Peribacteraceae bacterium]|nr:methionyl-tRNA formyltransferase [Candidatus Peribacteraceae bacterium]